MSPRVMRGVLVASLVGNLFLVGMLGGAAFFLRGRPPLILAGSLRIAGAELPQAERVAFRAALQETRRALQGPLLDGRNARNEAAALLRAPTLDGAALLRELDRVRAADLTVRAAVEARAVAFAATLAVADRARLADAVQRRADRRAGLPTAP